MLNQSDTLKFLISPKLKKQREAGDPPFKESRFKISCVMMLCLFLLHISFNKFRRLIWCAVSHSRNRRPLFMDYHIPWGGKVQLCRRHCDWFTADEDLLCLQKRKLPACCGLLVWPQSSLAPIGEKHPNKHADLTSGFVIFDKMSSMCCVT